jgi:hypothetical protein
MTGRKKLTPNPIVRTSETPAHRSRGRIRKEGASFPVPPPRSELPHGYAETLREIKATHPARAAARSHGGQFSDGSPLLGHRPDDSRSPTTRGLGRQGYRPPLRGFARGLPGHAKTVAAQFAPHACVRSRIFRVSISETACFTIAMGSCRAPAPANQGSRYSALVRQEDNREWVVVKYPRIADRRTSPQTPGQSSHQL